MVKTILKVLALLPLLPSYVLLLLQLLKAVKCALFWKAELKQTRLKYISYSWGREASFNFFFQFTQDNRLEYWAPTESLAYR